MTFLYSLFFNVGFGNELTNPFTIKILKAVVSFLKAVMPERSAKKIVAIVLLAMHVPVKTVVIYSGLQKSCLYKLRNELLTHRSCSDLTKFVMAQCIVSKGRGRKNPIKDIEQEVIDHIETCNYYTQAEIQKWIQETYNIHVSTKFLGLFLKKHGIRKLKCGSIPARANPEEQVTFYNDTLHPLMEKAQSGRVKLFFVDASHFVMGCDFIGSIYGKNRRFVKSLSGRSRYNVLGALDYASKKVVTVTDDTHITASSVCSLLKKIRSENKGRIIYFVLDNARYQKCDCVQELAKKLHIHLEYLPTYSPNLNLIERFWRFVKSELRKNVWDDYAAFSTRIDEIIKSAEEENKTRISKLIGEKVQLFNEFIQIDDNTFSEKQQEDNVA